MTITGVQVLTGLQKKHLVHLGNVTLDIQPRLVVDSTKAELITAIKTHLQHVQDCPNTKCQGPCKPDEHEFLEVEYTPTGDGDNSGIMAAITQILASSQDDMRLDNLTTSFLNPSNAAASHDNPVDPQQARLRLVAQTCAALGVDPQQFANQVPGVERQQPGGSQQQQHVSQQSPGVQPQASNPPPQDSSAALVLLLQQQQANHKEMMDQQAAQQDRLLKILESSQDRSVAPETTLADTPTSSSLSTGRVGVIAPRNAENLAAAGISLPPMLQIQGDLSTIDMSRMKAKLKSGRNWAGEAVASVMEPWPQQYLDRLVTAPVPHNKMSALQYFCGSITKVFSELDPSLRGSRVENQIRFLMFLSKQSLLSPWEDIIALSDSFYCALEQNSISWESWTSIQTWWDRKMGSNPLGSFLRHMA